MAFIPFLRGICFWGSFYLFYHYSSRDSETNKQRFPSYTVFKENFLKESWKEGFKSDKFSKEFENFSRALKDDLK